MIHITYKCNINDFYMPNANTEHQKLVHYTGIKVFSSFQPNIKCLKLHIPTYLSQH
jgi:predicted nucleotidyltransferase